MFELVIKNGTLVNPERSRVTVGHLGINNGKIAAITREDIQGKKEIDAGLNIVSPGFIDIHAHVDGLLYPAQCSVRQGITSTVGGNCGLSPVSLADFFNELEVKKSPINQAMLIGHTSLREEVGVRNPYGPASRVQVEQMLPLLENAFSQGAIGLSFGLEYCPGASFDEILALCRVAAKYDKLVTIHTRTDSWAGIGAIKEVIRIAEVTGVRIQVSHLVYQVGMGMMKQALAVLEQALRDGLDVAADSGLYHAFATFIGSAVYDDGCLEKWGCDYQDLIVGTGKYAGQRCTPEMFSELRNEYKEECVIAFACREAEVYEALLADKVMVSTDTIGIACEPGKGHPQDAGTHPRFFQKLVREQRRLTLPEAVKKCTLLPADRLGLSTKGRLSVGSDADIVIFNLNRITDNADYPGIGRPDAPPEGIEFVVVNGEVVLENGFLNENLLPGTPIRAGLMSWSW